MDTSVSIIELVEDVYNRLNSNGKIVIDSYYKGESVKEGVLSTFENLPTVLSEFYSHCNGLSFAWHVKDDKRVRGGISIPIIENVHNTRFKNWGALDITADLHAIFERSSSNNSTVMMESLEGDEDIEMVTIGDSILTITDYFITFQKTLGFRFWQERFDKEKVYTIDSIIENEGYLWG